jgi:DNA-binding NtrC family response regulator
MAIPLPLRDGLLGRSALEAHGVPDPEVSARHVEVSLSGPNLRVRDLGSRNGTFVNGARLAPGEVGALREGSVLRVGRTLFVVRLGLSGQATPDPPLGRLVSPFGLRPLRAALGALVRAAPRAVLLVGETGSGKELVAEAVASSFGRAPLLPLNLGAVPTGVFESVLFGHVAGAFSGASKPSRGALASASGASVLLDEIGELPLELQPKLLRALELGEIQPVGSPRPERVDTLFVCATHRPLESMVVDGRFRADLLARLAAGRLEVPPLRARVEDIPSIVLALAGEEGRPLEPERAEIEAVEQLALDPWPTNVLAWAVDEELGPRSAPSSALTTELVERALLEAHGNETEAARRLGVSRGALRRFLGKA